MALPIVEEERVESAPGDEAFRLLLERLSRQSVTPGRHFDAYTDIDWDAPEMRIDPADPRFELPDTDEHSLGRTDWYRAQPQPVRARIGLHLIANSMKTGLEFESVLKRGLLEYATRLPNRSAEFRYVYHEVIEEAQHSLMFQEFVNRSGFDPPGIPRFMRPGTRLVIGDARRFPEMFFVFVLGGEDPIDHVQRTVLRQQIDIHPLLERIMRIHVTEEARHLSFARHYLRNRAPELSPTRRRVLAYQAPVILAVMAQMMMRPSPDLIRTYSIPAEVVRQAYTDNPQHHAATLAALRKVRELCQELGLITPGSLKVWQKLGIWS